MTTPEHTLQTLAELDPNYATFAAALPSLDHARTLPEGFAEAVVALVGEERPEFSPWLDAQTSQVSTRMVVDPITAVGVLAAIVFLLRSHIRIEGDHFLFEHQPIENDLLGKVLDVLKSLLGGKGDS
jgi:hypothetical protein